MKLDLSKYRTNVFSQNGEDGVIEKLFEIMDIHNGWLVEFGAWDGKHFSNIHYHSTTNKYKTLRIEGVEERFDEMLKNVTQDEDNILLNLYVDPVREGDTSLNGIFERYDVNKIALLSIDVDGPDLDIFNTLDTSKYRPAIVIIEMGKWNDSKEVSWMNACFQACGYTCIHVTGNFIFIDKKYGVRAVDDIHTMLKNSGNPEVPLFHKEIDELQYQEVVRRFNEPDIFSKLAGRQEIYEIGV